MMAVLLPDVSVAVRAANTDPRARAVLVGNTTLADFGESAAFALDRSIIDVGRRYLVDAADVELEAGMACGYRDALDLLDRFIDQVVAERSCTECGVNRGRPCVINNAHGGTVERRWVHQARLGKEVAA